eukprot:CAMPEP_0172000054 /NCGR_PEP_ID=MMETSP1041-20130122/2105_1 /TAXON_ID=464988 /ORGANISM="Hemiselmis andersenii, Strain CCMP439" /LENGTH=243 /DNA_ID=CAMNT_0012653549 /DNA_START=94 /DNA_END=822 /DNA_ORIENTATION=+
MIRRERKEEEGFGPRDGRESKKLKHSPTSADGDREAEGDNEYLARYREVMAEIESFSWLTFDGQLGRQVLCVPPGRPEAYSHIIGSYIDNVISPLKRIYSWAIPTVAALRAIQKASPSGLCEVGAGTGYWGMLLSGIGVDVVAYDRRPVDARVVWDAGQRASAARGELNTQHTLSLDIGYAGNDESQRGESSLHVTANAAAFSTVQEGGADAAALHPERTLMLCWPPSEDGGGVDEARFLARD